MPKRTLKRQLNLFQVIMLGTAGTLGSGIFVLTGLAAEVAGPATVLAVLVGGLLSFSIALNYCELATIYPETGGAMTYVRYAVEHNVPMYTKTIAAPTLADGIINEIKNDPNVKLVLMSWLEDKAGKDPINRIAQRVISEGKTNIGIFKDKGLDKFEHILVPVGGGVNSRLAIHLANDIAMRAASNVTYIRVIPKEVDEETNEDLISYLQEILLTTLGEVPANSSLSIRYSASIADAILDECEANEYDLVILGSSTEPFNGSVFGKVCDRVVEESPYSILVVHRYQSAPASWLRYQAKRFQRD